MDTQTLKQLRKQVAQWALSQLETAPTMTMTYESDRDRYIFTTDSAKAKVPKAPGFYVFYSLKTARPVYVAASDHIKRSLDHEIRPSGLTPFKNRWVRYWMGIPPTHPLTRDEIRDVAAFIRDKMFVKTVIVPLGRTEAANDVLLTFKLRTGPTSIDPIVEF